MLPAPLSGGGAPVRHAGGRKKDLLPFNLPAFRESILQQNGSDGKMKDRRRVQVARLRGFPADSRREGQQLICLTGNGDFVRVPLVEIHE
jgi:hypothetical protein